MPGVLSMAKVTCWGILIADGRRAFEWDGGNVAVCGGLLSLILAVTGL